MKTISSLLTHRLLLSSVFILFLLQRESKKKKKEEGRRTRADKQQVLDMLFSAFERHQFYNIKDLVDLTKQPVVRPSAARVAPDISSAVSFLIFPALFEENPERNRHVQHERIPQAHLGAQARIPTLRWRERRLDP